MVIQALCELVYLILEGILGVMEILPDFPESLVNSLNTFFDLIFDNLSLASFFIRIETVKIIVPLFLAAYNFEYIYKFIMWIVRKIPVSIE